MGTFMGKRGNDLIRGSKRDDYIYGREGDDTLFGGAGNDKIYGGIGADAIYGETGNDRLEGEAGADEIHGGDGNDFILGGTDNDLLFGDPGNDVLSGGLGDDWLVGGWGDDELRVEAGGNDVLTGGAGADAFLLQTNAGYVTTITDLDREGGDILLAFPYFDANASQAGNQQWEFVAGGAPTSAPTNGNGQATVTHADGQTILTLYNNDADFLTADVTIVFDGTHAPEDLQFMMYNVGANAWIDPAILFTP